MCRANQRSRQLWGVMPVACSTVISPRVSLYVTLGHPVQLFVLMKAWCDMHDFAPRAPNVFVALAANKCRGDFREA